MSGYTASIQRQQVRAQVWPRIERMRYPDKAAFVVTNRGVGSARMMQARVTVDKVVKTWGGMLDASGCEGPSGAPSWGGGALVGARGGGAGRPELTERLVSKT